MGGILTPGHSCWRLAEATQAGVLIDARDYYRAFYRAAERARRYVAIAGWQFDSHTRLLRGADAEGAALPVEMVEFLNALCERNASLEVYLLAWDFHPILALERQWGQGIAFGLKTNPRLHFRWDSTAPVSASHHQKLVVVDGQLAFAGGMDICDCRWDDRDHPAASPHRCDEGREPHGPYHDVQAAVTGPAAEALAELFRARWLKSGGGELTLPRADTPLPVEATVPLPPGPVGISRTFGRTVLPDQAAITEVRELYAEAIARAERLIYVENQYFSSQAVYQALVARMAAADRPRVEVAFVLPRQPEGLREQIAMGVEQVRLLEHLGRVAAFTGSRFGVYTTAAPGPDGDAPTYVHAKLMAVDDTFLTIGSANTSNRSMGVDSELNLSWEAGPGDAALRRAIRRLRTSLLAEHTGLASPAALRTYARGEGLVPLLDGLAREGRHRLRHHKLETLFDQHPWLQPLAPERLVIDPESAPADSSTLQALLADPALGLGPRYRWLNAWLLGSDREPEATRPAPAEPAAS